MSDKKKLYESLALFVDAVASGDADEESVNIKSFISEKTKMALEFTGDSSIQLRGDDVNINGKKVGEIKSDARDMDSGINFVSDDGKFSKEFEDIEQLYAFLSDRFNIDESTGEMCWDGYKKDGTQAGTGKNKGKRVNKCVPEAKEEADGVDDCEVDEKEDKSNKSDKSKKSDKK
jgi:hypothetical protein